MIKYHNLKLLVIMHNRSSILKKSILNSLANRNTNIIVRNEQNIKLQIYKGPYAYSIVRSE